ncbi:MAG: hypothetical protein II913_02600 [Elusimicrobiaceae bacterium]|nr:hypothetical protein [Elusimicrobiaceae bacterium]
MVYKKFANAEGQYIDAQQARWDILEAHEAYTPEGLNVGWDAFNSIEAVAAAYGLTYQPLPAGEINAD